MNIINAMLRGKYLLHLTSYIFLAVALAGCTEDLTLPTVEDEGEIKAGEPVLFTTYVPTSTTRAMTQEQFNAKMDSFKVVEDDYTFKIEMYKKEDGSAPDSIGSGIYRFDSSTLDSTLAATTPLYWPDNVNKYGFKATAGSATLEADQSDSVKFLNQDRLVGYGFMPVWFNGGPTFDIDTLNYRTSKEWYKAHRDSVGLTPASEHKKIPLFMQHKRARITIRLKAGEGVERSALSFDNAATNIHTYIHSYQGSSCTKITPLALKDTINYGGRDDGVEADGVSSTQYTCVVEPHDYLTGATSDTIASINVSGQRFTFYASNDSLYNDYTSDVDRASHMQGYNLTAGKHLVITATLGRGSRKILITAYVVDWDETVTTSIVDDYGQNGDPIAINSRNDLYNFLKDPKKNKAGSVAIIAPNELDLERKEVNDTETAPEAWDYTELDLNATLNLAGATLYTDHRIFRNITSSGSLVNGNIYVGDSVESAIAETNLGAIERIDVDPKSKALNIKASRAGIVVTNSGLITACTSTLPVVGSGNGNVLGGIAAISRYAGATMPVIDGCTINAPVRGSGEDTGGGIVGQAVGRVTNNNFIYGITIQQSRDNFKNSIHSKLEGDTHELRAYGNAWPTTAGSGITGETNSSDEQFEAVLASQSDLVKALESQWNLPENKFRLSDDFEISKAEGWTYGKKLDIENTSASGGNVRFLLDGDNHTITTDAMLFTEIQNVIKDLNIELSGNLIATNESTGEAPSWTDAIATLAYSVNGATGGTLSNVKVNGGVYRIQAPTVGGIVVWAYGGAVIEDCSCKATIQIWTPSSAADGKKYSGGIVANAENATITRCVFHSAPEAGTLYRNQSEDYTQDGSAYKESTDLSTSIYYGGILGGTVHWGTSQTTPTNYDVKITDCSSWFVSPVSPPNPYKGAIVGFSKYEHDGTKNGLATGEDGCQGNWWSTTSRGIGTMLEGTTEEQNLGKRNAVTPTE